MEGRSDAVSREIDKVAEEFGDAAIREDRTRKSSGGDRQGGGAAFGIERVFDQLARFAFTAAATGGAAGARLHVFERARAACNRAADVMIGNGFADADVHGGFFEVRSTAAI